MKPHLAQRAKEVGKLVAETGCTIRVAAKYFAVVPSTVHRDLRVRLPQVDKELAEKADAVLEFNKAVAPYRATIASKKIRERRRKRERKESSGVSE